MPGLKENVFKQGVRTESLRGLHYLFATQVELERSEFKALLSAGGLGDRLGTARVSALGYAAPRAAVLLLQSVARG